MIGAVASQEDPGWMSAAGIFDLWRLRLQAHCRRSDVFAVRKELACFSDAREDGRRRIGLLHRGMKRLLHHSSDHGGGGAVTRYVRDQDGTGAALAQDVIAEIAAKLVTRLVDELNLEPVQ